MDGADVGMIQGRGGLGFALKARERVRVVGNIGREEFQGDKTVEADVLCFVDDTHATAAEPFDNAVVRDGLPNHGNGVVQS